ncbi:DUF4254 domain-containing protein [Nocardia sp. NBC_00881]|uniref:DUF4254 domain-containing protein n=1 Tax=Nocardia sp. NBC_00881 TaxID=2975995 RepID=UPI00386F7628|nr:DUF4254 domain-containing protein [Nocardia sp. NBC_00881]
MSAGLPTRSQLLHACRDGNPLPDHPVLRRARELAALHARSLGAVPAVVADLDEQRAHLVRDIDRWAEVRLPPAHGGAYLHTESLGAVIDRLARLSARAYAALADDAEWDLWFAWERLAESAVAYEDLATELATGRRRLPNAL